MSKRSSLSFAESAIADLEEVIAWFTEQGLAETGKKLVEKVILQTERLTLYPDSGRLVPEFATKDLREIVQPPFRIVYRREKRKILVVRIWRSERLLKLP